MLKKRNNNRQWKGAEIISLTKPDWQREAEELVGITADELREHQQDADIQEPLGDLLSDLWNSAESEEAFLSKLTAAFQEWTCEPLTLQFADATE